MEQEMEKRTLVTRDFSAPWTLFSALRSAIIGDTQIGSLNSC